MNRAAVFALATAFVRIELFKQRWQILDNTLQSHFCAIDQLMTIRAVPFKSVQRALGAWDFNDHSDGVGRPLRGMAQMLGQKKYFALFDRYFQRRLAGRLHDAERDVSFQLVEELLRGI